MISQGENDCTMTVPYAVALLINMLQVLKSQFKTHSLNPKFKQLSAAYTANLGKHGFQMDSHT
jgi:hypothetical protein